MPPQTQTAGGRGKIATVVSGVTGTVSASGMPPGAWPSIEAILQRPLNPPRWLGWRLRAMVLIVVAGLAGVLLVAHWLAAQPKFPLGLQASPNGEVRLGTADYPTLQRLEGLTLLSIALESPAADGSLHTQVAPCDEVHLASQALTESPPQLLNEVRAEVVVQLGTAKNGD